MASRDRIRGIGWMSGWTPPYDPPQRVTVAKDTYTTKTTDAASGVEEEEPEKKEGSEDD